MKSLCLIFLVTTQAFALSGNHLLTKPNAPYMAYFLKSYLPWHEEKYSNKMFVSPEIKKIQTVMGSISHWKVEGYPVLDQFLIGQTIRKGKSHFNYRAFVKPELRIKKEWFIEWDEQGLFCTLSKTEFDGPSMKEVPNIVNGLYFIRDCNSGPRSVVLGTSVDSKTYFNLFPGSTTYELRTYTDGQLTKILYSSQDVLIDRMPKEYYPRIISHGAEALLPLDKFEFSRSGDITVYYP